MQIEINSSSHKYIYSVKQIWDKSKGLAIIVLLQPHKDMRLGITNIQKKLVQQLKTQEDYGGFLLHFLFPSVEENYQACSHEAFFRNLTNFENNLKLMGGVKDVICAWGSKGQDQYMFIPFLFLATKYKKQILCFGINKENVPREPSYLKINSILFPYEPIN